MKPIELTCPSCQAELTLDSGFSGGVCRCSHCQTLMTVPEDPASQSAEQLVRPEAPPPPPPEAQSPRTTPGSPPGRLPGAGAGQLPGGAGQDYTTASGRTVRIADEAKVPTAPRRRTGVRIATAVVVFGLIALAIAGGIIAIFVMLSPPTDQPTIDRPPIHDFAYDPQANPYLLAVPNALGMPLSERTAVVVDASDDSGPWFDLVVRALRQGLTRPGRGASVAVIYTNARGAISDPSDLTPLPDLDPAKALLSLNPGMPGGDPSLFNGLTTAFNHGEPNRLVLVCGFSPTGDQLDLLDNLLANHPDTIVDVVAIGRDLRGMEDLARAHGGTYAYLAADDLQRWADAS